MTEHWEHFNYSADIGVRGFGPSENAELAATSVIADLATIGPAETLETHCKAFDDNTLPIGHTHLARRSPSWNPSSV